MQRYLKELEEDEIARARGRRGPIVREVQVAETDRERAPFSGAGGFDVGSSPGGSGRGEAVILNGFRGQVRSRD